MNRFVFFVGLFVAGLSAQASAQITASGGGYLFRMKFKPGTTISYSMVAGGNAQGQAFSMNTPMTTKVKSFSGGIGTLDYKIGPIKMMVNGKSMGPGQTQNLTLKMDSRGNVVGGTGGNSPGGTIGLPAKPIKVGGTWSATTKTNTGMGMPMDVAATYRFIGFEKLGGINAAKIGISMKGKGSASVTGGGTMWLSVADGSMIKTMTSMKVSMGQQTMPMTMSITRK